MCYTSLDVELSTHELAWAAGFIDGEGHIGTHGKYHTFQITVSQVDTRVLERLKAAVGGLGSVTGPHARNRTYRNARPQFSYNVCNFQNTQAVFALLWRWLSPVKRAQGKDALQRALVYKAQTQHNRVRLTTQQRQEILTAAGVEPETRGKAARLARALGHSPQTIARVLHARA